MFKDSNKDARSTSLASFGVFIVKSEIFYLFPVVELLILTWQMLKKTLWSLFMDGV